MRIALCLLVALFCGCGFTIPEPAPDAPDQADITNWDFSPCLDDWDSLDTCMDLLTSNQEVILGGYTAIEVIGLNLEALVTDTQPVE